MFLNESQRETLVLFLFLFPCMKRGRTSTKSGRLLIHSFVFIPGYKIKNIGLEIFYSDLSIVTKKPICWFSMLKLFFIRYLCIWRLVLKESYFFKFQKNRKMYHSVLIFSPSQKRGRKRAVHFVTLRTWSNFIV